MKLLNNIGLSLLTMLVCLSCEKENQVYDADLAAVRFNLGRNPDSIVYSFALMPGVETDTVEIPVQILGFTVPQDRKVSVAVVPEITTATEGKHYRVMNCEIPGGTIGGVLKVVLYKTPDLQDTVMNIAVRLIDSPDLLAGPVNGIDYKIMLTDRLTRPSDWLVQFGEYSVVKHKFIIEVTGKGTWYKEWKWMQVIYNLGLLNKALYEYNNAHPGAPLTDEHGIPVTFPVL